MPEPLFSFLELVTAPATEPISRAEAKTHLREDGTAQDTHIDGLIIAARQAIEAYIGRGLIDQTWDLKLSRFPNGEAEGDAIILPYPPLSSVTSVKYVNGSGVETTLVVNTDYVVLKPSGPNADRGLIDLAYGKEWPTPREQKDAVRVRFIAGYGASGNNVPAAIRNAMLLLIGDFYENREAQIVGPSVSANAAVRNLLAPYRIPAF